MCHIHGVLSPCSLRADSNTAPQVAQVAQGREMRQLLSLMAPTLILFAAMFVTATHCLSVRHSWKLQYASSAMRATSLASPLRLSMSSDSGFRDDLRNVAIIGKTFGLFFARAPPITVDALSLQRTWTTARRRSWTA